MAIKYEKLQAGVTYWQRGRQGMGNTTMTRETWWPVRIIELLPEKRWARASWNCNSPTTWFERELAKLYTAESRQKILAKRKSSHPPSEAKTGEKT